MAAARVGAPEQRGEADLRHGRVEFARDREHVASQRVGQRSGVARVEDGAARPGVGRESIRIEHAITERARLEGRVGEVRIAMGTCQRRVLGLVAPADQAEGQLVADDARPGHVGGRIARSAPRVRVGGGGHLDGREVRHTDVSDLALVAQLMQCAQRLGDGYVVVRLVDLAEVEPVAAQAREALFDVAADRLGPAVPTHDAPWPTGRIRDEEHLAVISVPTQPHLREQLDAIAASGEDLAESRLHVTESVERRRVDRRDAEVEGRVEQTFECVAVELAAAHAAVDDARDLEVGGAQPSALHRASLSSGRGRGPPRRRMVAASSNASAAALVLAPTSVRREPCVEGGAVKELSSMSPDSDCQLVSARRDRLIGARVVVAGGASVEHGYVLPGTLQVDAKYTSEPQPRLAGGSSVNHACRLLAMGVAVDPILPLAAADPMSTVVMQALDDAARTGRATLRREDLAIPGTDLRTPFSTIIRQGASRTVLNEFSAILMRAYSEHVDRRVAALGSAEERPGTLLVGHVHADREPTPESAIGFAGGITEGLLTDDAFAGCRKFVNFGRTQYAQGTKRWDRILRDHVDVFQLDLGETRRFCRDAGLADGSLHSILGWFRDRCTVVVTLERFGAIGQLEGSATPVAAWPYVIDDIVDTTGAGDALGAGLVVGSAVASFLDPAVDDATRLERFQSALGFGRVCGAYACTTLGGAIDCPSLEALARFERDRRPHARDRGPLHAVNDHDLFLIDRAFDR